MQVRSGLPSSGGPHAIFLPRQKRQARVCFFSGADFLLAGAGLRRNADRFGDVDLSRGDQLREIARFFPFGERDLAGEWLW